MHGPTIIYIALPRSVTQSDLLLLTGSLICTHSHVLVTMKSELPYAYELSTWHACKSTSGHHNSFFPPRSSQSSLTDMLPPPSTVEWQLVTTLTANSTQLTKIPPTIGWCLIQNTHTHTHTPYELPKISTLLCSNGNHPKSFHNSWSHLGTVQSTFECFFPTFI